MNPAHKLYAVIGGIVVLLIVASLIGKILRARATAPDSIAVVDNLVARTRAWWGMVGVFAAAFCWARPQRSSCSRSSRSSPCVNS